MSMGKYILSADGERPIPCDDLLAWGKWFEQSSTLRRVAASQVGHIRVSTVFLALDHGWGDGPPLLWETMTFAEEQESGTERCAGSREQAQAMHEAKVAQLKAQYYEERTPIDQQP